jgi:hypothetical protein
VTRADWALANDREACLLILARHARKRGNHWRHSL